MAVDQTFLPVTARYPEGGFCRGLTKNDFRVFEDGVPQDILYFYAESGPPVHVALLLDASGSTRPVQAQTRRAALEFVGNLGPDDKVAVILFNSQHDLVVTWTNDVTRIEAALESFRPRGTTALHDALAAAYDVLETVQGRRALVVLTDGADTGSTTSRAELIRQGQQSEAVVYVISKLDQYWAEAIATRLDSQPKAPIPEELSDEYIARNRRFLYTIAQNSGGSVLDAGAYLSLSEVYQVVADELKNQYYISYVPKNVLRDGTWRKVEVRVSRPGVLISTKPGYYAPVR